MRVEAMPRRRPSMWLNEVAKTRGGYLFADENRSQNRDAVDETRREGAKESGKGRGAERAMPIRDKASAGKRLKREEGRVGQVRRWRAGDKCQRSEPTALVPVKKGTWDEGESKKEQVVLVKRACP